MALLRERAEEISALADARRAVLSGGGAVVLIEGPAGIGKTSLIAEARQSATGMRVLSARGSELERDFPFGVARQLLEPTLYDAEPADRSRWLGGAAALAAPLFADEASVSRAEEEVEFRRRHGLYWLVANLARESPVLVVVDDAQWADAPSSGFLRHLAPRIEPLPILLVIAARPHAGPIVGLQVDPLARVLRPAALSEAALREWMGDELGEAAATTFAAAGHRATGGNPFLVRELLREVRAERVAPDADGARRLAALSPRSVMTAVLLRLAGLSDAARKLARATAVLDGAELEVAAGVAGLEIADAVEAAGALIAAGVLEPADRLTFVHPIVRTVLYEDVLPAERAAAHSRAARLLHERGSGAERTAAQLALAAPVGEPWAVAVLHEAARGAAAAGAPEVAARYLERALAEPVDADVRVELVLGLGRAQVLAAMPDAVARLREALALAQTSQQRVRASVKLGRVLRYAGAGGEAVTLLEQARDALDGDEVPLAATIDQELLAAATVSYEARRRLPVEQWLNRPRRPAQTASDRFVLAAEAVEIANRGGTAERVVELAGEVVEHDVGGGHLGRHTNLLALYALLLVDRFDLVAPLLTRLEEEVPRRGGAEMQAVVLAQRALVGSRRGHLAATEADAAAALELATGVRSPPAFLFTAGGALLTVAAERDAEPHPLAAELRDDGDSLFGRHLNHAQGALDIAQGRRRQGVDRLLAVGARETAIGWGGACQFDWRSRAGLALAQSEQPERAAALVEEELGLARATGAPRALGIALRAAGLLAGGDAGIAPLEESVATLAGSGADLEHARSLVDLGAALRRARRPSEARTPLRQGHELALRCSADALVERAHQELLASGARPRRSSLQGPDALTPSERRVVELAASGLSNRDIAQALFVTEKTVEAHLGRAFPKLGVRSRRQLTAALAGDTA